MALLLNILWLIFGGLELGLSWLVASLIMFVSIVGIPWGRAAFNIAVYTFFPFGIVHFKLLRISLAPIGLAVVPKEVAEEARRRRAGFPVERRRPY